MKELLIRCDGGVHVGLGHYSRCSALASELVRIGGVIRLVTRGERGTAERLLGLSASSVHYLSGQDGAEPDANDLGVIGDHAEAAGLILIDHYGASDAFLARLQLFGTPLVVIDDDGLRELSNAEWIVNVGADRSVGAYPGAARARQLLGLEYAMLRKSFSENRRPKAGRGAPRSVVVALGGAASVRHWQEVADVAELIDGECHIWFLEEPRPEVSIPRNCRWTGRMSDPAPVMASADVAISAAGTTALEFCCLGVPTILLPLVGNQHGIARALERQGAALVAWTFSKAELADGVWRVLREPGLWGRMHTAALGSVDGFGTRRIVSAIAPQLENGAVSAAN